jgi:hypothetical protein
MPFLLDLCVLEELIMLGVGKSSTASVCAPKSKEWTSKSHTLTNTYKHSPNKTTNDYLYPYFLQKESVE